MNTWINIFFLTCIFLCATYSAEVKGEDFGRWQCLMEEGSYRAASVEAERIYFHATDRTVRSKAVLARTWALKHLGDYNGAFDNLRRISPRNLSEELQYLIHHERALLQYLNSEWEETRAEIRRLNNHVKNRDLQLLSEYLDILARIELQHPDKIAHHIETYFEELGVAFKATGPEQRSAGSTRKKSDEKDLFKEEQGTGPSQCPIDRNFSLPVDYPDLKNQRKAVLLSTFIPGAGQIYAGQSLEGMGSAALQLASLAWGVYNITTGYYLAALFTGGGPFQAFYFGGIDRAERHAVHHNRSALKAYKRSLTDWFLDSIEPELMQKRQAFPDSPFLD